VTALMAAAAAVAAGSAQAGAPPPSTERKAAAVQKAARDMKEAAALRAAATAAGKKKKLTWLRGKYSHTYEQLPNGNVYVSTIEFVGYRGAKDASRPRVGMSTSAPSGPGGRATAQRGTTSLPRSCSPGTPASP